MLSAQSQRSCRYVLDFTSLRVFSNLRSFSIFFLQKLTFIWLLCSDITRMDLSALIEQLLTMRTEVYSANTISHEIRVWLSQYNIFIHYYGNYLFKSTTVN